jgi:hypothetical protein
MASRSCALQRFDRAIGTEAQLRWQSSHSGSEPAPAHGLAPTGRALARVMGSAPAAGNAAALSTTSMMSDLTTCTRGEASAAGAMLSL